MSDFTNELLRLSELREKGLISQEEFEAAKAKLFGDSSQEQTVDDAGTSEVSATESMSLESESEPATMVLPLPPLAPPAADIPQGIPPGIAGWSWGAFLWNWIWAIFNNTWIGLLALIPGVNLIMIFVLGAKGREWAWKNKKWDSVEHFNRVQRKWSLWGIWLVLGGLILAILLTLASFFFLGSQIKSAMDANSIPAIETSNEVLAPVEPAATAVEETVTATDAATGELAPVVIEDTAAPLGEDTPVSEPVDADQTAAQDVVAEQDRKHQEELAKTRAEAAAAKAEAAKAKKEALKAEKALAEQKRREREEEERLAQEEAEREQMQCPYSKAQPLTCASRKGQPAQCDWNFRACGNPRIAKKESKTSCEGKVEWDTDNDQLIVTDGCRAQFIPVQ